MQTAFGGAFFFALLFALGLVLGEVPARGDFDGHRATNPKGFWGVMKLYAMAAGAFLAVGLLLLNRR